ncbi:LBP / BPI / CETP family C-terminal domain protein [Brugia pahangi]
MGIFLPVILSETVNQLLFAPFLLLLEIVVWELSGANDSELEVQPLFNNVDVLKDGDVITREIQKRASGTVKRPRAAGFAKNVGAPPITPGKPAVGSVFYSRPSKDRRAIGQVGAMSADFNPALLRGYRGNPGIKIRVNRRTFQYASTLLNQILDREIVNIQIPDVRTEIKEVFGEATICNIHVSNYRSPQCINIFPAPPNHIVLNLEDFDIGVTGNLDGIARIILPIQLSGIVHANFYHVSVTITVKLERSVSGAPQVVLCGCNMEIPFADVCIQCGGLLGNLANLFFRQQISERVRSMVPDRFCGMLPQVINERINPMLARIPQSIPFTQFATLFTNFLGGSVPAHCLSPQCQARSTTPKLPPSNSGAGALPPRNPPLPPFSHGIKGVRGSKNSIAKVAASAPTHTIAKQVQRKFEDSVETKGKRTQLSGTGAEKRIDSETSAKWGNSVKNKNHVEFSAGNGLVQGSNAQSSLQPIQKVLSTRVHPFARNKREAVGFESSSSNNITDWSRTVHPTVQSQQTVVLHLIPTELHVKQLQQQKHKQNPAQKLLLQSSTLPQHSSKASGQYTTILSSNFNRSAVRGVPVAVQVSKGYDRLPSDYRSGGIHQIGEWRGKSSDPCAGCPPDSAKDSFGAVRNLIKQQLNLRKVANLVLTTQLLRSYATYYDYNLDLNGEFSPNGRGGTPFGPFPMQWPTPIGSPMIEILISDFTVNSLLYWMHKANFLSFRIGPETPGIGALLTTTCDVSNDYSGEEFENEALLLRLLRLSQLRRRYYLYHQQRSRRQAVTGSDSSGSNLGSLGDLADLGICLGDIIPAIKEKYPNTTLALSIHSARAPSITISRRGGGSIQLDSVTFIDIYLDKTNVRVGTITVITVADIMLQIMGQRIIANASLPVLKLIDRDQTLGLQQDALDNLASLAKDMILRAANQQFNRGIEVSLPTSGLPINVVNPHIQLLDHAVYIGSDFTVAPSAIQMIS